MLVVVNTTMNVSVPAALSVPLAGTMPGRPVELPHTDEVNREVKQ